VGNQQLSIHIKRLLDYLKSSKNFCPRKLFSGSNSSPEKSLQKNRSIFCQKNRSCDRRQRFRFKHPMLKRPVMIMISIATTISSPIFSGTGCERAESAVGIRYTEVLIHTICAPHLFLTPPPLQSGDRLVALQHCNLLSHSKAAHTPPHSNALSSRFINNTCDMRFMHDLCLCQILSPRISRVTQ